MTAIQPNPTYDGTFPYDCYANEKAAAEQGSERQLSEIPAKIFRQRIHPLVRDRVLLFALLAAVSSWPILRAIEALRLL